MRKTRLSVVLLCGSLLIACGGSAHRPAGPLDETWGIQPVSVRVSPDGDKLDFRYRVRNVEKAVAVVNREVTPVLEHRASGTTFELPHQRRVGGARPPVKPELAKNYFVLFENSGHVVRPGDAIVVRLDAATPVELVAE